MDKSGALKERDICRDKMRSLQGLERLGHKNPRHPFVPGRCKKRTGQEMAIILLNTMELVAQVL